MPFLKETQLYHFVEDNSKYNPLFRNQGDSKSPHDVVMFASNPAEVDAEILSGVAKGRLVTKLFKSGAMGKQDPRDFKPNLSPLTPYAKEISIKVHNTLKITPGAYQKQIDKGMELFENDNECKQQIMAALKCKSISIPVARETFTMLNRGVLADKIRSEVVGIFREACKYLNHPSANTQNKRRCADIVSQKEIEPNINAQENSEANNGQPIVTVDEVCRLAADIKNDPIIRIVAQSEKCSILEAAMLIAIKQTDEVLNTLAIKSILDGNGQPTNDQLLTKINQQGGPKPFAPIPAKIPPALVAQVAKSIANRKRLKYKIAY